MTVLITGVGARFNVPPVAARRIVTPAPGRRPLYPPLLDLAEAAAALPEASSLLVTAVAAIAPRYEELAATGLTSVTIIPPGWDDVVEQDGTGREDLLVRGLAEGIARHPEPLALLLPRVDRWDYVSTTLLRHLLVHPDMGKRHIVVLGLPDPSMPPRALAPLLADARSMDGSRVKCQHQPAPRSRRAALALYDAWDPAGWGYLRRALLVAWVRDLQRLTAQHGIYFQGFRDLGRDFLYQHLDAYARRLREVSSHCRKAAVKRKHAVAACIGAARLAPRVRGINGYRAAVRHYGAALRLCSTKDAEIRIRVLQELANVHAVQRRPEALARARRWYARGMRALEALPIRGEARLAAEIRLINGLALVEYHEHHDTTALALERRAFELAEAAATSFPRVAAWALPLLSLNTARLLERRFADPKGASSLLASISSGPASTETRARAALELGRLHFEAGDFGSALVHLEDVLANALKNLDAAEETLARLLWLSTMLRLDPRADVAAAIGQLARQLPAIAPGVFDTALNQLRHSCPPVAHQ